jgi:hypothetical protein
MIDAKLWIIDSNLWKVTLSRHWASQNRSFRSGFSRHELKPEEIPRVSPNSLPKQSPGGSFFIEV